MWTDCAVCRSCLSFRCWFRGILSASTTWTGTFRRSDPISSDSIVFTIDHDLLGNNLLELITWTVAEAERTKGRKNFKPFCYFSGWMNWVRPYWVIIMYCLGGGIYKRQRLEGFRIKNYSVTELCNEWQYSNSWSNVTRSVNENCKWKFV